MLLSSSPSPLSAAMAKRKASAMKAKKPMKQAMKKSRRGSRKPRGKAKALGGGNSHAARQHHDAMGKMYPLAVPGQMAHFVTINGLVRTNVTTDGEKIILFTWCPTQIVRFSVFRMDNRVWTGPNFTRLGNETGSITEGTLPVSLRPLRMSVRIRNITPGQNVGGSVRVIQADDWPITELQQSVNPFAMTAACMTKWRTYMDSHPLSHTYSAAELRTTHRFVLKPGQEIPFRSYHQFKQGMEANANDNKNHTEANVAFAFARAIEPMTALAMYMPDLGAGNQNTYEITVHFQDAAQFEPASPMHSQARPPAPANEEAFRRGQLALGNMQMGNAEHIL